MYNKIVTNNGYLKSIIYFLQVNSLPTKRLLHYLYKLCKIDQSQMQNIV